jgi:hypothetical protein
MQLKIQRSQRTGGLTGATAFFCLDVRAQYAAEEAHNITRYGLGKEVIYNSQAAKRHLDNAGGHLDRSIAGDSLATKAGGLARGVVSLAMAKLNLNISIASLGRGHHIECKDLAELLDAEGTIMEACRNTKKFLAAAATFNGSEVVVDFDNDEKTLIEQTSVPLLEGPQSAEGPTATAPDAPQPRVSDIDVVVIALKWLDAAVAPLRTRWNLDEMTARVIGVAGALLLLILLYKIF